VAVMQKLQCKKKTSPDDKAAVFGSRARDRSDYRAARELLSGGQHIGGLAGSLHAPGQAACICMPLIKNVCVCVCVRNRWWGLLTRMCNRPVLPRSAQMQSGCD